MVCNVGAEVSDGTGQFVEVKEDEIYHIPLRSSVAETLCRDITAFIESHTLAK